MVDTRSPDQVILVFSTLPAEIINATLQRKALRRVTRRCKLNLSTGLDDISGSLSDGTDLTWHVDNRYYEVDLRIRCVHDRARLLEHAREGAPAVVMVVDSAEARQCLR